MGDVFTPGVPVPVTLAPTVTPLPTVSLAPSPAPTPRQTPALPFVYPPEGDTAFGFRYRNDYDQAHVHAYRRPGWSWHDPSQGYGPFCFEEMCFNVTDVCDQFGGTLLHDYVCSFPDNINIMGPSCWHGECLASGSGVCSRVDGVTVGVADGSEGPQWCIFGGTRSFIGPMCYGPDCFASETIESCNRVPGGRVWNRDFCVVDGFWTVVGPICWSGKCIFGDTLSKCVELEGELFARRWCLIRGCDWTVIGPTCSNAIQPLSRQCFEERTREVCKELKGTELGQRFCVLPGTQWTMIGPTVFATTENIGKTRDFCGDLGSNLAGFFNFIESYDIDGRFCLIKDRLPTTGPMCTDKTCNQTAALEFCDRFGGNPLAGGFMCTVSPFFRQVVGPMRYADSVFEGDPELCVGDFCAVPDDIGGSADPRCPVGVGFDRGCAERRDGCVPDGFNCTVDDLCIPGNLEDDDDDQDDDDDDTSSAGTIGFFIIAIPMLFQCIFFALGMV